ncbi:KIN14J, partial [Symbiodinium microadriaticum]
MNDELMRKAREATRSVSSVQEELDRERDICLALTNDHCDLENEVKRLRQRIVKLNDTIVELKGSIMVFCRVRPVGQREVEELDITQAEIDRLVHYPDYNLIDFKQNTFEYDRVFSPASTQEVIYDEVEPFVRSAMGGVNLRALSTILHLSEVDDKYATTVTMSMLEVYNEKIRDLLTLDEETVDLDVRMGKTGTYVDGLGEYPIRTLDDALETIGRGAANRMVASNHVNEHSSRSHLVSLIK